MKDEIESIPQKTDACETRTPHEHQLMFKTLENPLRRKIIKSIGDKTKNNAGARSFRVTVEIPA